MYSRRGPEEIVDHGENMRLRHILHELSNLLTGVLVSGGLLRLALRGDRREQYAVELCEIGERGAALVREGRLLLTPPEERLTDGARQQPGN